MNKKMCLPILALALIPQMAAAWGPAGHKAVAMIAQDRLSPEVRQKVRDIIGTDADLPQIASCADFIRDDKGGGVFCGHAFHLNPNPESSGWHYIDIPISDTPEPGSLERYCRSHRKKDNCVVDQIRDQINILSNPSSQQAEKQIALMFLVHFVGDIHQPLHCATEKIGPRKTDRGGNDKLLTFMGQQSNMHKLWDDIIEPPVSDINPYSLARSLEQHISDQDAKTWTDGDVITEAAMESFNMARDNIYPAYKEKPDHAFGADYQREMQPIAYERIEKAGVRLAYLLEQALGTSN